MHKDEVQFFQQKYHKASKKYSQLFMEMNEDLELEFKNSNNQRGGGPIMSQDEYQEQKEEIRWDIAWQIFDEVNEFNDID